MAPAVATYEPRDPSRTALYTVIADHLETFLASLDADPDAKSLPAYVQREFYDYLQSSQSARRRAPLSCEPLRRATAAGWGRGKRQRRVLGECSCEGGAKRPFEFLSAHPAIVLIPQP